jgi:hypothetical protein
VVLSISATVAQSRRPPTSQAKTHRLSRPSLDSFEAGSRPSRRAPNGSRRIAPTPRHTSRPPDAELDAVGTLRCPACGSDHTHHGATVEIASDPPRIGVEVTCEQRHGFPAAVETRAYVLTIQQHEGSTLLSWELP